MKVGYLTIVFADDVSEHAARQLVDEVAEDAFSYQAVESIRCDVGEFEQPEIDAFYAEAVDTERPRRMTVYDCIAEAERDAS